MAFGSSLLLLWGQSAKAQLVSFGLKGGIPANAAFSNVSQGNATASDYTRRYTVGPTVELHLPLHFSLEVDALYRRNGFSYSTYQIFFYPAPPTYETTAQFNFRSALNDWQVPILAKYEMVPGPARPFVDGGLVYRSISGTSSTNVRADHTNVVGIALGGGISFKLAHLRIEPEIRYIHWPTPPYSGTTSEFASAKNQADILLGITF